MKEQSQRIESLEKENQIKNTKVEKKRAKIQKLKENINSYHSDLQNLNSEMIKIEEKNINLAEFIRKEIQNKSLVIDPSPPTFKEHANNNYFTNEYQSFKSLNKSYDINRFSDVASKDSISFSNIYDNNNNSSLLDYKGKYKQYGKEPTNQVLLIFYKNI